MTKWQDANGEYAKQQSAQWKQSLTANRDSSAGRLGRIEPQDALIADPRNGIGAVRVGDRTPEQAHKAAKQGHNDRVKAEHDARKAKKPTGDRADGSGYRRDAFDFEQAHCWQQGSWVYAHGDGVLLKWRKAEAPAEVLAKLAR